MFVQIKDKWKTIYFSSKVEIAIGKPRHILDYYYPVKDRCTWIQPVRNSRRVGILLYQKKDDLLPNEKQEMYNWIRKEYGGETCLMMVTCVDNIMLKGNNSGVRVVEQDKVRVI